MRLISLLALSFMFFIPAGFAIVHGHGRNGYDGWVDTMYLDNPLGMISWALWAIWFFKPLVQLYAYYMKGG